MRWIDMAGSITRYEWRKGTGRPLVLIHEMGGTLNSWDRLLEHLTTQRPILRYDMRGAGISEKLRDVPYIEELADDLVKLLDELGIQEQVDLAGSAIGAAVSLMCASRHAQRISSVVALSPVTEVATARRLTLLDVADRMQRGGLRSMVDAHLAISYPAELIDDPQVFQEFRARWIANDPESFALYYRMLAELDIRPSLKAITCPVLVIGAKRDALRPVMASQRVAEQVPDAKFLALDTGHFMHVQSPAAVGKALEDFLSNQQRVKVI